MPGRRMSGFHRPGGDYLHQARITVRYLASRMKGEMHASKSRMKGDSVNELTKFPVCPPPETAMGVRFNFLVGALPCSHYVIRPLPLG